MREKWYPAILLSALLGSMFYALHHDLSQPPTPSSHKVHNQSGSPSGDNKHGQGHEPETLWQKITNEPVAFTTLCLTGVTAILAISTIGLWIVTGRAGKRQSKEMRNSIAEAARAATAMEGVAAGIAHSAANTQTVLEQQRRYAQMQLRAYLSVIVGAAVYQESGKGLRFEAKPAVINTGNTPAHNVTVNLRAEILPIPPPPGFGFPLPANQVIQGGSVIGPRQDRLLSAVVDGFVLDPDVPRIRRGERDALTVWGTISYSDVFGETHITNFCQILTWLADERVHGFYHPAHNYSD